MQDITAPKIVEVVVRNDNKVLWVNVDGACVLRICQIPALTVEIGNKTPHLFVDKEAASA